MAATAARRTARDLALDKIAARFVRRCPDEGARIERGRELAREYAVEIKSANHGLVRGSRGDVYVVLLDVVECECIDFRRRLLPCKHYWALAIDYQLAMVEQIMIGRLTAA